MVEPAERLTEDDRTQAAADQFLERALAAHRVRARASRADQAAGCLNCGAPIPELYCDADCRADHIKRGGRQ